MISFFPLIDVQSSINRTSSHEEDMMIPDCAEAKAVQPFCQRLVVALGELKVRLEAQYLSQFPGQEVRIRKAIEDAEAAAWRTSFPHLFLPDLAEEAIERSASP